MDFHFIFHIYKMQMAKDFSHFNMATSARHCSSQGAIDTDQGQSTFKKVLFYPRP